MKRLSSLKIIYGLGAIVGAIVTMYFNILFIIEHQGFSVSVFIAENYVNYASSSIMNDLWVVLCAFLIWSYHEARRLSMPFWWAYVLATFSVAIAFSLPLFLCVREFYVEKSRAIRSSTSP